MLSSGHGGDKPSAPVTGPRGSPNHLREYEAVAYRNKYSTYDELRRHERDGVDYRIYTRNSGSPIAVIAPHGGLIEPGTTEVAASVAGYDHAFYCFEGLKKAGNSDLHIASTYFDEPSALQILRDAELVLAIHGCDSKGEVIYLGGLHRHLIRGISEYLTCAGFIVRESTKPELRGTSPHNICNKGRTGAGVQLELSQGLRKRMLGNPDRHQDKNPDKELYRAFILGLRKVLLLERRSAEVDDRKKGARFQTCER